MRLFNDKGQLMQNCLCRGTGKQIESRDTYTTTVFYHENNPVFEETIRIDLKHVPDILNCHLLILIGHCSSGQVGTTAGQFFTAITGQKKKKERDLISFAFLPLKDRESGVILGIGEHYISCYSIPDERTANNLENDQNINPFYLRNPTLKPRPLSTTVDEHLKFRIYISSKKITDVQEVHELFSWHKITQSELDLAIKNCINLETTDDLLTSIIPTK